MWCLVGPPERIVVLIQLLLKHLLCDTVSTQRLAEVSSYLTYPEENNGNQSIYSAHRQNISFIEHRSNKLQNKFSVCPKRH